MIKIREAKLGDEMAIAKVHIQSWQETYCGLVPQDYLEQLPSEINERIEMWKRIMANPERWAWVAEGPQGIVGFVLFGPPRDESREGYIELGAIYLLASQKRNGIGFSLLSAGFNKMKDLGYKKAYCWVLDGNSAIKFYNRSGAKPSNQIKEDHIGGKNLKELAYEWDSLSIGEYNCQPLSIVTFKHQVVAAIIYQDGRFLMGKRSLLKKSGAGYWSPICGRVEKDEDQVQAIEREVFEEVGLQVKAIKKVAEFDTRDKTALIHWWTVKIISGYPHLKNDEHSEIRWLSIEEMKYLDHVFSEDIELFRIIESTLF